jgi:hypothetical protein
MGQRFGAWRIVQLVHVRDLAEGIVQAGTRSEAANDIFNVAGIEAFTYRGIAAIVRRLAGFSDWTTSIPDRSRTWQRYVCTYDVTKAQRRLGFRPRVMMQEGLEELVAVVGTQETTQRRGAYAHHWRGEPGTVMYPGRHRTWPQSAGLGFTPGRDDSGFDWPDM